MYVLLLILILLGCQSFKISPISDGDVYWCRWVICRTANAIYHVICNVGHAFLSQENPKMMLFFIVLSEMITIVIPGSKKPWLFHFIQKSKKKN